ncbi:hypothetical protein DSO57_1003769 [Entomophthora muscae]|uniref:Uncharacterized protein n=1 Tax=Entomophthora muscae TaxID=34485 RepID=A0ACC2TJD8_9FUNG|nr:hypothetical protein DSO57_1003769 [Entomophthora muscae]
METTPPLELEMYYNSPMGIFNTPMEKELVFNNMPKLPMSTEEQEMDDNYKPVVPGILKHSLEATTLKIEKLSKGISIDKLFEDTSITISLAVLFQESPTLQQKAHKAVLAFQPHRREKLFLAGTGAPRTEGAINRRMIHIIPDKVPIKAYLMSPSHHLT